MKILGRLAFLFVVIPVLELVLLIELGRYIGPLPTIGIVVLTGVTGAWLARTEGLRVFFRFQEELVSGRLPGQAMLDGICVLVGGAFLLTPGVITDVLGFSLLLPFTRQLRATGRSGPGARGFKLWPGFRYERGALGEWIGGKD